ncbi:MAG: hypothetical protein Q8O88_04295 [bacterium]|nr:hypothetical protein [bacterium]
MEESENQLQPFGIVRSEVSELNELIAIIVDYYCFKHSYNGEEDEEEGEEWKKKMDSLPDGFIVPKKMDKLVEDAFSNQLKRFTIDKSDK